MNRIIADRIIKEKPGPSGHTHDSVGHDSVLLFAARPMCLRVFALNQSAFFSLRSFAALYSDLVQGPPHLIRGLLQIRVVKSFFRSRIPSFLRLRLAAVLCRK
jgi:hypothetical protein